MSGHSSQKTHRGARGKGGEIDSAHPSAPPAAKENWRKGKDFQTFYSGASNMHHWVSRGTSLLPRDGEKKGRHVPLRVGHRASDRGVAR